MFRVYQSFLCLLILTLFASCGGGDDGYRSDSYKKTYGMCLLNLNDSILEIRFAPITNASPPPVYTPNSRYAPLTLSTYMEETVMFITTAHAKDTVVVKSTYQLSGSTEISFTRGSLSIVSHTFDSAYLRTSYNTNNYSYRTLYGDTLYFRVN